MSAAPPASMGGKEVGGVVESEVDGNEEATKKFSSAQSQNDAYADASLMMEAFMLKTCTFPGCTSPPGPTGRCAVHRYQMCECALAGCTQPALYGLFAPQGTTGLGGMGMGGIAGTGFAPGPSAMPMPLCAMHTAAFNNGMMLQRAQMMPTHMFPGDFGPPGGPAQGGGGGEKSANHSPPDNESKSPHSESAETRASEAALGLVALLAAAKGECDNDATAIPSLQVPDGAGGAAMHRWGEAAQAQVQQSFANNNNNSLLRGRLAGVAICSYPGCTTDAKARGLCGKHGA